MKNYIPTFDQFLNESFNANKDLQNLLKKITHEWRKDAMNQLVGNSIIVSRGEVVHTMGGQSRIENRGGLMMDFISQPDITKQDWYDLAEESNFNISNFEIEGINYSKLHPVTKKFVRDFLPFAKKNKHNTTTSFINNFYAKGSDRIPPMTITYDNQGNDYMLGVTLLDKKNGVYIHTNNKPSTSIIPEHTFKVDLETWELNGLSGRIHELVNLMVDNTEVFDKRKLQRLVDKWIQG